jgi:predicted dehydrogenase
VYQGVTTVEKLRVGVIGCGQIAQIMHLPYLKELDHLFEIAALADISRGLVEAMGELYGVARRYTDYQHLLAQRDIDAVAILTPDHYEPAIAAAQAGKHILVEKPLCFNLHEADKIITTAQHHGVTVMVGYMKRYDPGYRYAQARFKTMTGVRHIVAHDLASALRKGSVGPVADLYRVRRYNDVPQKEIQRAQTRMMESLAAALDTDDPTAVETYNLLLGLCSHDMAVLRGAFGLPDAVLFTRIFGNGRHLVSVMTYRNDETLCTLEVGGFDVNRTWFDERLTAHGTDETVSVRFPNPFIRNVPTTVHILEMDGDGTAERIVTPSYDEAFRLEWQHFHECVVNGQTPVTDAQGARDDIALLRDVTLAGIAGGVR